VKANHPAQCPLVITPYGCWMKYQVGWQLLAQSRTSQFSEADIQKWIGEKSSSIVVVL
jgi:hypothetical protein